MESGLCIPVLNTIIIRENHHKTQNTQHSLTACTKCMHVQCLDWPGKPPKLIEWKNYYWKKHFKNLHVNDIVTEWLF